MICDQISFYFSGLKLSWIIWKTQRLLGQKQKLSIEPFDSESRNIENEGEEKRSSDHGIILDHSMSEWRALPLRSNRDCSGQFSEAWEVVNQKAIHYFVSIKARVLPSKDDDSERRRGGKGQYSPLFNSVGRISILSSSRDLSTHFNLDMDSIAPKKQNDERRGFSQWTERTQEQVEGISCRPCARYDGDLNSIETMLMKTLPQI